MSTYSLSYLAHLVQTKNDINRRRRRFWNLMNPGRTYVKVHPADERIKGHQPYSSTTSYDRKTYQKREWKEPYTGMSFPKPTHPAYSIMGARKGYKRAGKEMRAMTKHMREVRTQLKAKFKWDDNWAIRALTHENKTYKESEFKALAAAYQLEQAIRRTK